MARSLCELMFGKSHHINYKRRAVCTSLVAHPFCRNDHFFHVQSFCHLQQVPKTAPPSLETFGSTATSLLDVLNSFQHCADISEPRHINVVLGVYLRYPTNALGFSVAGKCPRPFMAWCLPPGILSQVAWPIAGVLDQSYSPVSIYTGHLVVLIEDMRERPSQPPWEGISLAAGQHMKLCEYWRGERRSLRSTCPGRHERSRMLGRSRGARSTAYS